MADYNTSLPIAGDLKVVQLQSTAADTYYVGMTIAIAAATGKIAYSALGGASPVVDGIVVEEKTVAIDGYIAVAVTGTEWLSSGIVDNDNKAVVPNAIDKAAAIAGGIILR